jgi:uncharacterized protein YndB with AHSA1/START domain
MSEHGQVLDENTVRFERLLPGPIGRVWEYLVIGDKRAEWFCGGDTDLEVGGRIQMLFDNDNLSDLPDLEPPEKHKDKYGKMEFAGTITRCDPPNVFAHTWEFGEYASEVSYELTEQGGQVLLVLTHSRLQSSEDVLSVCGGWHSHLELLDDVLEGRKIRPYWKTYRHYDAEYSARLGRTD